MSEDKLKEKYGWAIKARDSRLAYNRNCEKAIGEAAYGFDEDREYALYKYFCGKWLRSREQGRVMYMFTEGWLANMSVGRRGMPPTVAGDISCYSQWAHYVRVEYDGFNKQQLESFEFYLGERAAAHDIGNISYAVLIPIMIPFMLDFSEIYGNMPNIVETVTSFGISILIFILCDYEIGRINHRRKFFLEFQQIIKDMAKEVGCT